MKKEMRICITFVVIMLLVITIAAIGNLLTPDRIKTINSTDKDIILEKTGLSEINISYSDAICQDDNCIIYAKQEGLINTVFVLSRYKNMTSLENYTNQELRERAEALTKEKLENYADALRQRAGKKATKNTSGRTVFNEEE